MIGVIYSMSACSSHQCCECRVICTDNKVSTQQFWLSPHMASTWGLRQGKRCHFGPFKNTRLPVHMVCKGTLGVIFQKKMHQTQFEKDRGKRLGNDVGLVLQKVHSCLEEQILCIEASCVNRRTELLYTLGFFSAPCLDVILLYLIASPHSHQIIFTVLKSSVNIGKCKNTNIVLLDQIKGTSSPVSFSIMTS